MSNTEEPTYKSAAAGRYFRQAYVISAFMSELMEGVAATSKCYIDHIESGGKYGIKYEGKEPIHADPELSNFMFGMILTRIVENYLSYLTEVLETIFRCQPNLLRASKEDYKLDFILQFQTMDELISATAEKKIESLSFQSMSSLAEYFKNTLKVQTFRDDEELKDGIKLNEVRNLIVHQRGVVNKRFAQKFPELGLSPGDLIQVDHALVVGAHELFKLAVMNTDINASERYKFPPPSDG